MFHQFFNKRFSKIFVLIILSFMNSVKKLKQLACFSIEKRMLKRKLSIVNLTLCCEHVVRVMMKWNLLFLLNIEFFFVWLFCCELIVIRIIECLLIRSLLISFPKKAFLWNSKPNSICCKSEFSNYFKCNAIKSKSWFYCCMMNG